MEAAEQKPTETENKPFAGATHRLNATGQYVKAVCWKKDGDHPKVERYPIERRQYKGLLVVDEKRKLALRFGDWILEDEKGRLWLATNDSNLTKLEVA